MKRSYIIAAGMALVAAGWILSGQLAGNEAPQDKAAPAIQTAALPLVQVRVRTVQAADRVNEMVLLGRTEAFRSVQLKAETAGRIVKKLVAKGDPVKKGDVIVRIAMDDRLAQLRQTEAIVEQRRIAYKAAQQLSKKAFRSKVKLAEEKALLEVAKAALRSAQLDIERTTIRAPYNGVINELPVEIGDYVSVGSTVAKVVDLEPLLVTGEIAERDIDRIRIDQPVGVRFVGGGETTGVVSYVSKVSSNTARTFRIEVTVDNANGRLGEGLTTELRLETGSVRAHRVTPAILTLSDDGVVGVKAVDADGRVLFHKATVVADEPGGVWLGGLPESLTLITIGQEFVRIGQVVKPVEEKAGAKQ